MDLDHMFVAFIVLGGILPCFMLLKIMGSAVDKSGEFPWLPYLLSFLFVVGPFCIGWLVAGSLTSVQGDYLELGRNVIISWMGIAVSSVTVRLYDRERLMNSEALIERRLVKLEAAEERVRQGKLPVED